MRQLAALKRYLLPVSLGVVLVLSLSAGLGLEAHAFTQVQQKKAICAGQGDASDDQGNCITGGTEPTVPDILRNISNIIVFFVGAVAVIIIIIAGLQYALSGGDQSKTKGAKDAILYALVGVGVDFAAWAIVNFVIRQLTH